MEQLLIAQPHRLRTLEKPALRAVEQTWVEKATVLRAVVGSTVHGLALDGTDDSDEMGICIEPLHRAIGLNHLDPDNPREAILPFEQFIYRTAEERLKHIPGADQRHAGRTPPSKAGDTDLTVYSLRKFAKLAAEGNPSILILLFAPPLFTTPVGAALQAQSEMFASRVAGERFLGYLQAQRERLLGTRGQMRVTRQALVDEHGYDTKYAMHAVRLGWQGVEYLERGRLTLPLPQRQRNMCMAIRRGEWDFKEVVSELEYVEGLLVQMKSPLPEFPDYAAIDDFVLRAYTEAWSL